MWIKTFPRLWACLSQVGQIFILLFILLTVLIKAYWPLDPFSPPLSRALLRVSGPAESLSGVVTAERVTGVSLSPLSRTTTKRDIRMGCLQIHKGLPDCWNLACWQEKLQHKVQKKSQQLPLPHFQTAILQSHTPQLTKTHPYINQVTLYHLLLLLYIYAYVCICNL